MAQKDSNESYIHYYAKQVLIGWLKESRGKFFSMNWSGNRIYEEYPLLIADGEPLNVMFDSAPSKICNCTIAYGNELLNSRLTYCRHRLKRDDQIPSRQEAIIYGFRVGAIIDVVVADGDRIKYFFEICHTNPVSPMKRKLLLRYAELYDAVVYEIDSEYILRQVCSPSVWRGTKLKTIEVYKRKWKVGKKRRYKK